MRHAFLGAFALGFASVVSVAAQTPPPITVTVTGDGGGPVSGVRVTTEHPASATVSVQTDAKGQAVVRADGESPTAVYVDPNPGSTISYRPLVVVLPPGATTVAVSATDFTFSLFRINVGIESAAHNCHPEAYDRWVREFERTRAALVREVEAHRAAAESFRGAHGLPGGNPDTIEQRLRQRTAGFADAAGLARALGHATEYKALLSRAERAARAVNDFDSEHRSRPFPPRPEKCEKQSSAGAVGTQFYASADAGPAYLDRPSSTYFRTELGGVVLGFPAIRMRNDSVATQFAGTFGATFEAPFLGPGRRMMAEARAWRVDGNSSGAQDLFTPPPGATTGLFSPQTAFAPFGGYFTGSPLSDIRQSSRFADFGGEARIGAVFVMATATVTPFVGFRVSRTSVEDQLALGIGAPAFTTFNQSSDVRATTYAPMLGVRARQALGGGFALVGEGSVALQISRGSGRVVDLRAGGRSGVASRQAVGRQDGRRPGRHRRRRVRGAGRDARSGAQRRP